MKIIFAIEKALSKITSQNKLMLINLFHRQRPKCLNSFFLDSFMSRAVIRELSHGTYVCAFDSEIGDDFQENYESVFL